MFLLYFLRELNSYWNLIIETFVCHIVRLSMEVRNSEFSGNMEVWGLINYYLLLKKWTFSFYSILNYELAKKNSNLKIHTKLDIYTSWFAQFYLSIKFIFLKNISSVQKMQNSTCLDSLLDGSFYLLLNPNGTYVDMYPHTSVCIQFCRIDTTTVTSLKYHPLATNPFYADHVY